MARMRAKTRRLRVESLEQKTLLAGDVISGFIGNVAWIRGDSGANELLITAAPEGGLLVTGQNGTNVNGVLDGTATLPATTTGIIVDLRGGADILELTGLTNETTPLPWGTSINMGEGEDRVEVNTVDVRGALNVNTGSGADVLSLLETHVAGSLVTTMGSGGETLLVQGLTVGSLFSVITGADADTLLATPTAVDPESPSTVGVNARLAAFATLGEGDTIDVQDSTFTRGLALDMGRGADQLLVDNVDAGTSAALSLGAGGLKQAAIQALSVAGPFTLVSLSAQGTMVDVRGSAEEFGLRAQAATITTGAGNDTIVLNEADITRALTVFTAGGTDAFWTDNTTIGGLASINMGLTGNKTVGIESLTADQVRITTGMGSDQVTISSLLAPPLNTTDFGPLTEFGLSARSLSIVTGAGNDTVSIDHATLAAALWVQLGLGDDALAFNGENLFHGPSLAVGGFGTDTLARVGTNTFDIALVALLFEA